MDAQSCLRKPTHRPWNGRQSVAETFARPRRTSNTAAKIQPLVMKHFLVLILLCAAAVAARAQSTAFTFQGRLAANGLPYTGSAEMQCLLFSSPTGGVALVTNQPAVASVNVNNGLFTVPLDFGAGAFPGAPRFLEIQVRTNLGAYFTLTPRQALTPSPSALFALTAGTAQGPWLASGSDLSYTAGKVGIGTSAPAAKLDVRGGAITVGNIGDQADLLWFESERSWVFRRRVRGPCRR